MRVEPLVSIGISFKNPGPFFPMAIRSVFAQTFRDWELILFDDMSTDGSFEFAESLDDPRVRVIRDGNQLGLNIRLNQMVGLARGKYFFRMDSDDVMHPERVALQILELEKHGPDAVIGSACYSIDANSCVVGVRPAKAIQQTGFKARRSFHHPTVAAFTDWFRRNPYAERFPYFRAEDAELWCRTTGTSRFINLPDRLLFYREGASSFPAYIDTQMVVIHLLIERFRKPRAPYLAALFQELLKIAVAGSLEAFGYFHQWVSKRYTPATPEQVALAMPILRAIEQIHLPLRPSSSAGSLDSQTVTTL